MGWCTRPIQKCDDAEIFGVEAPLAVSADGSGGIAPAASDSADKFWDAYLCRNKAEFRDFGKKKRKKKEERKNVCKIRVDTTALELVLDATFSHASVGSGK